RERQTVVPMSGLVFCTADGSPLHSVNVTLGFQRALRRLGLPRRRFHDLRHTFATLALEAGEDLAMVSRALGHASVAITADTYMHVTPAMRDGLAARMEAVLGA
ncbi:MAG: tyrosine-type recombinase/integrase, partial [Chloroflexota bacterium]|nr:tyrosine-type recombinase/integrase [Chloroflexota bacterium]